jgi:hypothetical protein
MLRNETQSFDLLSGYVFSFVGNAEKNFNSGAATAQTAVGRN